MPLLPLPLPVPSLEDRRVLITGGARGIGAALAHRLHERGAKVALLGLESELLEGVAAECGAAPWRECDVSDRAQVDDAVDALTRSLGGLDVVVANAGIAAQLPLIGGNPEVLERTIDVNVLGTYYTLRAAGPHVSHDRGYVLLVSSLAAAIRLPLLGAYNASKAAVEALGDTLRLELRPSGARVGVAYFSELDTEMTHRGFGTEAAKLLTGGGAFSGVTPLSVGISALERGIARRSRRIAAPGWIEALLPIRMAVQPLLEVVAGRNLSEALEVARAEDAPFTTEQPSPARETTGRPR